MKELKVLQEKLLDGSATIHDKQAICLAMDKLLEGVRIYAGLRGAKYEELAIRNVSQLGPQAALRVLKETEDICGST